MTNDKNAEGSGQSINRRTVLKGAAAGSAFGLIGIPTISGSALATQAIETCGDLDIMCAIDTSGSLSSSEISDLEEGVNSFIDELPTDDSVTVGTLEFGNGDVRNKNDLQDPSGLSVSLPSSGSGNTPMPGATDIADQAVYNDSEARSDAIKLVVLFTDGGPNYTNTSYTEDYTAPRDDSEDWSAVSGDSTYDNADTASATVSEGEMDETALVAGSVKDGSVGDGATLIATVYVGDDDTEAMTSDAISTYTDLPTYLESEIASSSDLAIDADLEDIEGLVDDLVGILEDLCCTECPEDFNFKYEWVEDEEAEGECKGEFVIFDDDDNEVESVEGLELVSVSCDEDGEPQEACFETTYCELAYEVKAGQETDDDTVSFDETGGEFCVTGIEDTNPQGESVTYAISNIVFTCP
ncbi:VWA domain-containing protein [Haloarcula sp. JP-L23]|uniref:VWA domain-containing protein n=1 Tax=Haloarcula sp. JP-L23 TaxID=2716717 RepID=UPI00140EBE0C|nr:VWA domain-containing protein [Haloarcula sp. JP-L23]